jgi:hypothetical protein
MIADNTAIETKIQKVDEQDEALGEYVTFPRPQGTESTATTTSSTTTQTWWVGTTVHYGRFRILAGNLA